MDEMQALFEDILGVEGVKGIMWFSLNGKLVFTRFLKPWTFEPEKKEWWSLFIYTLDGIKEAELVYDSGKLYVKRAKEGYLFVLLNSNAPIAMIRLNCDVLMCNGDNGGASKGIKWFFKKKGK